jgi:hypothetical protein
MDNSKILEFKNSGIPQFPNLQYLNSTYGLGPVPYQMAVDDGKVKLHPVVQEKRLS